MAIKRLKLKDLIATVKTQTRDAINEDALASYKEHAKAAKAKGADPSFPPLKAFADALDGKVYLGDGFTRRQALLAAGFEDYDVDVEEVGPDADAKREAIKYGFKANLEHGARLTNADKKHNLMLALEDPEWSQLSGNALAELLGVSEGFVRQNTPAGKKKTKVKTKKGTSVDTSNIGKKGGSSRKKAKAAKKGKKGADAGSGGAPGGDGAGDGGGKPADAPKRDEALEVAVTKIANAIHGHGFDKAEFTAAVKDGSLPVSSPDLKKWASTSEDRIRLFAPLVINERWSVGKAIGFIDKAPAPDTKAEHFMNLAVAHGGLVRERVGDYVCVWLRADDYTVGEAKNGTITIARNKK